MPSNCHKLTLQSLLYIWLLTKCVLEYYNLGINLYPLSLKFKWKNVTFFRQKRNWSRIHNTSFSS